MGSVMLRADRSIDDQGKTLFDTSIPTLTINGTKDGLLRISRTAESYWHQYTNIEASQAGLFPILAIEGVSHTSFMDSTMSTSYVEKNDLRAEIDEAQGYQEISQGIVGLVD